MTSRVRSQRLVGFVIHVALSCMQADQVLLFFKYYDPTRNLIVYVGHSVEPITRKFGNFFPFLSAFTKTRILFPVDIFPALRERAGLPSNVPLLIYEVSHLTFY